VCFVLLYHGVYFCLIDRLLHFLLMLCFCVFLLLPCYSHSLNYYASFCPPTILLLATHLPTIHYCFAFLLAQLHLSRNAFPLPFSVPPWTFFLTYPIHNGCYNWIPLYSYIYEPLSLPVCQCFLPSFAALQSHSSLRCFPLVKPHFQCTPV